MKSTKLLVVLLLAFFIYSHLFAQPKETNKLDVLEYEVSLEPFFAKNYIEGHVSIKFRKSSQVDEVVFDSGKLMVSKVEGAHFKSYKQEKGKTIIALDQSDQDTFDIKVFYHGNPQKGLLFFMANSVVIILLYNYAKEQLICLPQVKRVNQSEPWLKLEKCAQKVEYGKL